MPKEQTRNVGIPASQIGTDRIAEDTGIEQSCAELTVSLTEIVVAIHLLKKRRERLPIADLISKVRTSPNMSRSEPRVSRSSI